LDEKSANMTDSFQIASEYNFSKRTEHSDPSRATERRVPGATVLKKPNSWKAPIFFYMTLDVGLM